MIYSSVLIFYLYFLSPRKLFFLVLKTLRFYGVSDLMIPLELISWCEVGHGVLKA